MSDDAFAESLKSATCVKILFDRLKNVEKQMKEILILAKSTQEQQIKGEKQLNDFHDSLQFVSDKFKEYEEDQAKNNKTIGNLNLGSQDYRVKFQNLKSRLTSRSITQGETVFSYTESRK